jgi:hypothetical protein
VNWPFLKELEKSDLKNSFYKRAAPAGAYLWVAGGGETGLI